MEKWAGLCKNSSSPAEKPTTKPALSLHYNWPASGSNETQGQTFHIFFLGSFLSAFWICKPSLIQHRTSAIQNLLLDFWPTFQNPWHTKVDRRLISYFFQFPFSQAYMNTFMISSFRRCWTVSVCSRFSVCYLWVVGKAETFIGSQGSTGIIHCFFRNHVQSSIEPKIQMWREKRTKFESFGEVIDVMIGMIY